jgi:hypothetical protein
MGLGRALRSRSMSPRPAQCKQGKNKLMLRRAILTTPPLPLQAGHFLLFLIFLSPSA